MLFNYVGKTSSNGQIEIKPGCFSDLTYIKVDVKQREQILAESMLMANQKALSLMNDFPSSAVVSDFLVINPAQNNMNMPLKVRMNLKKQPGSMESVTAYRINSDYTTQIKIESYIENGQIVFDTQLTGNYVAKNEYNYTILIAAMVGVAFFLILVSAVVIFLYKNPKYMKRMRYTACNAKRSMSDQI